MEIRPEEQQGPALPLARYRGRRSVGSDDGPDDCLDRALAAQLGRRFSIVWKPDRTCGAGFDDLFEDASLERLTDEEALALPGGEFFSRRDSFEIAAKLNPGLFPALSSAHRIRDLSLRGLSRTATDTAIVLDNGPCRISPDRYLQSLAALSLSGRCRDGPNESPVHVGFHIRLTDFRDVFGLSEEGYGALIAQAAAALDRLDGAWRDQTVYVASDEAVAASIVESVIGRPVLTQSQPVYVSKQDATAALWRANSKRSAAALFSAGRDLAALAGARLRVGFRGSTFFSLAREMAAAQGVPGGWCWPSRSLKRVVNRRLAKRGLGPDIFFGRTR
ncbi:MAG: hypothetical protein GDA47_04145 [Rhodospirillales bacterium]|nr:hypothetical protein [Rhodospirillales bacterium]